MVVFDDQHVRVLGEHLAKRPSPVPRGDADPGRVVRARRADDRAGAAFQGGAQALDGHPLAVDGDRDGRVPGEACGVDAGEEARVFETDAVALHQALGEQALDGVHGPGGDRQTERTRVVGGDPLRGPFGSAGSITDSP